MKKIYLVTGNPKKVEIAKYALSKHGIEVDQLEMGTPEIQSTNVDDVAKYSVKYAADKTGKTVIKGDFGMVIEALNGFPGPFVKFINNWLNVEQFTSLYSGIKDPRAYFVDALGFCEPGKEPICFTTNTYGILTILPRGDNGNMVDSVFVPDGYDKTVAELNKEETIKLWANDRYDRLAKRLTSKK